MKYIILSAFLVLVLFGWRCLETNTSTSTKESSESIRSLGGLRLSPYIDSLFRIYRAEVPAKSYAIFIDKKEEGKVFVLTFAPFKKVSDYNESGASQFFLLNDSVPVFIYSGVEDILNSTENSFQSSHKILDEVKNGEEYKYMKEYKTLVSFTKSWMCFFNKGIARDSLYIIKYGVSEPFSKVIVTKPTVKFNLDTSYMDTKD